MATKRSFKVDGRVADVPEESVDYFIKKYPDAVEVKTFLVDKDTADVPLDKVEYFTKKYTNAKPLFEEESTINPRTGGFKVGEISSEPTPPPANLELGVPPPPKETKVVDQSIPEDKQAQLYSGLNDNDKTAITKTFSIMPINTLGSRKAREVFYNSYAKSRDLDPKILREFGERAAAESILVKGDELAAKGDVKGAEQLYLSQVGVRGKDSLKRLSDLYKLQGRDEDAAQLLEESNKAAFEKLPQVGSGSYKQPTYQPTTLGTSGEQGFTIEGDTKEIAPDTEETESSKYLNDIADAVERLTPGKAQVEMIEGGIKKTIKGVNNLDMVGTPQGVSAALNTVVGLGETALGAILGATPAGAANFAPFEVANTYLPPNVSQLLMPISAGISNYYDGKPSEDAQNIGFILDTIVFGGLHMIAKGVKGKITDAAERKKFDLGELDPESIEEGVKQAEARLKQYGGNTIEYKEAVTRDAANTFKGLKEISTIAEGKQEVAAQEPIRANTLLEIPEGTNVEFTTKNGKESGIIDRLDDGTWIFENENGTTEIPVKDKRNPIETLQELGIDITPDVAPDQVAKAMADGERVGWVEDKGKIYFVSLGNPKIEGSYDLVFRRNEQGGLNNVFDSHNDITHANNRKLKLINKLLEQEGLPKRDKVNQPPIKGEVKPTETVEPKPIEKVKSVEEVVQEPIEGATEVITEETKPTITEETVVEEPIVEQQPVAETEVVEPTKPIEIVEADKPTIESTKTEPVSEAKVEDVNKDNVLVDVRKFNSLSKKDRQTVGSNLKNKIESNAKKLGYSLSYDNKGKLVLLNEKGKKAISSPKKVSEETKQANKLRIESARKALSKQPSGLREWILQFLLSKGSISAKNLKDATGFESTEFPAFTTAKEGTTFHDLMEMLQGDTELNHILKDYTQDGFFDNQKFDSDVADVMTTIKDRKEMWKELMKEGEESSWRDQGFSSKEQYEYITELQAEADKLGISIDELQENHITDAVSIVSYMGEEEIANILKDLDEAAPKTIEEINKFYEEHDIESNTAATETKTDSKTSSNERSERQVAAEEKLEKAKSDLKNKRKQLLETLLEDNENLFGEKKSAEGKLFDEKADATKMEEALTPLKDKVKEAELELEEAKKSVKVDENQTSITSDVGKDVQFNHAGQDRIGTIVGEEGNNYVIESEVGNRKNTYTYPKSKAVVLEATAPKAIKARVNKAIDNIEQSLLNNPLFKDRSGGADVAGAKGSDVIKFVMGEVRKAANASIDLGIEIKKAIEKAKLKFPDWFKNIDEKAVFDTISEEMKSVKDVLKEVKEINSETKKQLIKAIKYEVERGGDKIVNNVKAALEEFKGKLTSNQINALNKKAQSIKTAKSARAFYEYAEKIIDNVNYDNNIAKAKGLKKALNKAVRVKDAVKKLGGNNIFAIKEFNSLNPSKVSNIEAYNDIANRLMNATKKVELDPNKKRYYVEDITNKEVLDYVAQERELAAKYEDAEILERYNDLIDQGILKADGSLTPEQMKSLVEAFDPDTHEGLTEQNIQAKMDELKIKQAEAKKTFQAAVSDQLKDVQEYLKTERADMTPLQIKNVEALLKLDPTKLEAPELARAYKQINNLLNNNSFASIEELAVTAELQKDISGRKYANRFKQDVKEGLSQARSIDQLMNAISLLDNDAAEMAKVSGLNETRNGFAQAEKQAETVFNRINNLEKTFGKDIKSAENNVKRWAISFIDATLGGTPEERMVEFKRKKEEVKQNARKLQEVNKGTKEQIKVDNEQGQILQKIYDEHFKDKNSVKEVLDSFDEPNKKIVKAWQEAYNEIAAETFETAELSHGQTNLPIQENYTSTRTRSLKANAEKRELDALKFQQTGAKAKMAGSKNAISARPLGESTVHRLDFDKIQREVYFETLADNKTARGATKLKKLFDGELADELFGSRENAILAKRAASIMIRQRRGDTVFLAPEERRIRKALNYIGAKSVQSALQGVTALPKQYISVATRAIVGGKGNLTNFIKSARFINHPTLELNNIGSRGGTKAGLERQSMAEKLLGKNPSEENVLKYIAEQVAKPLEKGDVWAARQSWVMYYMEYLKSEKGVDITKENWSELLDKNDQDASAFAEQKVSTTQNPNDPSSMAPIYSSEGILGKGAAGKLVRDIVLPFNSFGLNMKMQQIADLQKLSKPESRVEGAKSLAGNVLEQVAFNTLKVAVIAPIMKAIADELSEMYGLKDESAKYSDLAYNKLKKGAVEKIATASAEDIVFGGFGNFGKNIGKRAVNAAANLIQDKSPEKPFTLEDTKEGLLPVYENGYESFGLYGTLAESGANVLEVVPSLIMGTKQKFLGTKDGKPQYEEVPLSKGERAAELMIALIEFGKMTGVSETSISDINRRVKNDLDKLTGRKYGKEIQIDVMKKAVESPYQYLKTGSYNERAKKLVDTYKELDPKERKEFLNGFKESGGINYMEMNDAIKKIDKGIAKEVEKILN